MPPSDPADHPAIPSGDPGDPGDPDEPEREPDVAPSGFADLGLRPELLATLTRLGYEEPTPIQRETIPILLEGRDLLGQAATGTGKTAAFALPILQRIPPTSARIEPLALILVPTRELAVQVSEAIYRYGRDLGVQVLPIYGGQPIGRQLQALRRGVHVVVATPGRAIDHIGRGTLPLDAVQVVVLDEADEMLDMGFAEDIEAILEATPDDRQTVLFSATMPPRIERIIRRHLHDPARIQIARAERRVGHRPPRAPERLRRGPGPQAGRPGPGAGRGGARVGHRLLPHPHRGRPAHRDPQRAGLPGRGAARRHEPGAARPGDGAAAQRHRRPARRHRRGRPWPRHRPAHPRHQLRRAVRARVLRAPHRTSRAGRAGGRRHHPGRAPRAAPARQHRAADQAEDRHREGAHGRRPAGPPDGADPPALREAIEAGDLDDFRSMVAAPGRRVRPHRHRPGRGQAPARGQRRQHRRAGHPRDRHRQARATRRTATQEVGTRRTGTRSRRSEAGPRTRQGPGPRASGSPGRRPSSTSGSAGPTACAPRTSSGPSPTRPT